MATEKRLIDANALLKLLNKFEPSIQGPLDLVGMIEHGQWASICGAIVDAPTVNAVEVVRCKDCTRCKKGYCTIRKDSWGATLLVGNHDFCSDGERRTDNA